MTAEPREPESKGCERTTISCPTTLYEQAKARAEKDDRSFSSYITWLIRRDLEEAKEAA